MDTPYLDKIVQLSNYTNYYGAPTPQSNSVYNPPVPKYNSANLGDDPDSSKDEPDNGTPVEFPGNNPNSILADNSEVSDNDAMHTAGVTMGQAGNVMFGALHLGHVAASPTTSGFRGYHPSGVKTRLAPNRAKAALHLLALHRRLTSGK